MDIVSEINKKNTKVFRIFFDTNFPTLVMYADKYLNDIDVASDVAQEAFIQLWRSDITFLTEDKMKGFLYTTTRNISLNQLKHARIVSAHLNNNIEEEMFTRDCIIEQEVYLLVHTAIKKLAPQSKTIILYSMQGYSNQEIADKMNVSINTVRTLKQNAYKKLKGMLKEYFYVIRLLIKLQNF